MKSLMLACSMDGGIFTKIDAVRGCRPIPYVSHGPLLPIQKRTRKAPPGNAVEAALFSGPGYYQILLRCKALVIFLTDGCSIADLREKRRGKQAMPTTMRIGMFSGALGEDTLLLWQEN